MKIKIQIISSGTSSINQEILTFRRDKKKKHKQQEINKRF